MDPPCLVRLRARRNKRPVSRCALDDVVNILLEQEAIADERARRSANFLQILISIAIALFDGQARIVSCIALRLRARKRYVRAEECVERRWIADTL